MAGRYIVNLLKGFIFYLLLFALCRTIFLLYFAKQILQSNGSGIFFQSLYKAIPLDISTASYLMFLPVLLLFLANFIFSKWLMAATQFYFVFTALLCTFLAMVEIGVYREVHVKLYFNLLTHLEHFGELIHSVSPALLFTVLSLIALLSYFSFYLLNILFKNTSANEQKKSALSVMSVFAVFVIGGTFFGIGCPWWRAANTN